MTILLAVATVTMVALCAASILTGHNSLLWVVLAIVGAWVTGMAHYHGKLRAGSALLEAGHVDEAVRQLKDTGEWYPEEADYQIAVAYDRRGAHKLALECYRKYVKKHKKKGKWSPEARVRLNELEAQEEAPSVQVKESEKPALRCPFCKDDLDLDKPAAECSDCGTPYHATCYEEGGGCSVYGCRSHTLRMKVPE